MKTFLHIFLLIISSLSATLAKDTASTNNASPPMDIRLRGVSDDSLKKALYESSLLISGTIRPDASTRQIRWQANQDRATMLEVFESQSYFDATIAIEMVSTSTPKVLTFQAIPGAAYRMTTTQLSIEGESDRQVHPTQKVRGQLPLATTTGILAVERNHLQGFRRKGYPFARLLARELEFDQAAPTLSLNLSIDLGIRARYGPMTINGLTTVKPAAMRRFLTLKEGAPYNEADVRTFEADLLASGIFASARCEHDSKSREDGILPLTLTVTERKHRTIRAGVEYDSDTGAGLVMGWEHRNFRGNGDRLTLSAELREIGSAAILKYQKPLMKSVPLEFQASLDHGEEETDAFDNYATEVQWLYAYTPHKDIRLVAGAGYRHTDVIKFEPREHYDLGFIPLLIDWDHRDSLFDPRNGARASVGVILHEELHSDLEFATSSISGALYHTPKRHAQITLALRAETTSIQGASSDDLPADSLLYAGGASSVRGYEYQSIGAQIDGVPLGGTERITGSAEIRYRTAGALGYVLFADTGKVFGGETADDTFRTSLGAGIRYATGMGPLRLDLALPIDKRENIDNDFELYISIGHFF